VEVEVEGVNIWTTKMVTHAKRNKGKSIRAKK